MYGWGYSSRTYQLGESTEEIPSPMKLDFFSGIGVIQIAASATYSYVLTNNGILSGIGPFFFAKHTSLTPVPLPKGVTCFATGFNHSLAVLEDGTLWTWGESGYSPEMKQDFGKEKPVEVKLPGLGRRSKGGDGREETQPEGDSKKESEWDLEVTSIMCDFENSLVALNNGKIFVWGYNKNKELGLGHEDPLFEPTEIPGIQFWVSAGHVVKKHWKFMKLLFQGRRINVL
jgi:alpha-tubulin suppressor-like RCC1 family protein